MSPDSCGTPDLFNVSGLAGQGFKEASKSQKSVAQGNCPKCQKTKVGLVRTTSGHLAWRMHTYITWGGGSLPCPAVGVAVCVLPEATPHHNDEGPVRCAHA